MIKELDVVTLTRDIQDPHLLKGSKGAVVHCYLDGKGFEVEFVSETGESAVLTLERADIQPEREMLREQVLAILNVLPEDLLVEVRDFAEFLQQRKAG
jgi:hypothetical protein